MVQIRELSLSRIILTEMILHVQNVVLRFTMYITTTSTSLLEFIKSTPIKMVK